MELQDAPVKEYFSSKTAKVYYDAELDTLFLEYSGKVGSDNEFITINTAVLEAFKTLDTHRFVADIRKMGIISVNAQQWVERVLLPGMFTHLKGRALRHAQFLDPKEIFSKVSGTNIKARTENKVHDGFYLEQFSSRTELEDYLRRV